MRAGVHRAGRLRAVMLGAPMLALAAAALTACSSTPRLGWPFGRSEAPAAPEPVHEVVVTSPDGVPVNAFAQYWKRNTLVLDLQGAARTGSVVLKPRSGREWPPRLAFRIRPGEIGQLEVQARQNLLMPITESGSESVDLELVPGIYTPDTQQIIVRWEPQPAQ